MKEHQLTVKVQAPNRVSEKRIAKLLSAVILSGLGDAAETVNDPHLEGKAPAKLALACTWDVEQSSTKLRTLVNTAIDVSRSVTMTGPHGVKSLLVGEERLQRFRDAVQDFCGKPVEELKPGYEATRVSPGPDATCVCCSVSVGKDAQEVRGVWLCKKCFDTGHGPAR